MLFFGRLCWTAFGPPCLPKPTDDERKNAQSSSEAVSPARTGVCVIILLWRHIYTCVQCPRRQIAKTPFGGLLPASAKTPNVAAEQKRKIAKLPNCQVARQPSRLKPPSLPRCRWKAGGWTRRTFVWRLDTADNCRSCLAFGHGGQLSAVSDSWKVGKTGGLRKTTPPF